MFVIAWNVFVVYQDGAWTDVVKLIQQSDGSGLARSSVADQSQGLACRHLERHIVKSFIGLNVSDLRSLGTLLVEHHIFEFHIQTRFVVGVYIYQMVVFVQITNILFKLDIAFFIHVVLFNE